MQQVSSTWLGPRQIMLVFLAVSVLLMAAVFHLSLRDRVTGQLFYAEGELLMMQADGGMPQAISAIGSDPDRLVPVNAQDKLEEPDILPLYSDYRAFLQRQTVLAGQFAGERLWLLQADGDMLALPLRERRPGDLRAGFYIQLVSGLLCVMICGAIWAFNRRAIEAQVYLLMGLGIALSCWTSAIYTSRELALDGQLFRLLSLLNHLGAIAFGGGLIALFAIYPCRLLPSRVALLMALSFVPLWLADSLQLADTTAAGFHLPLLVYVLIAFALAFWQWRASRERPADRAVLKWLLLSVMGTSMIFTLMNIVPAALMATTFGAQSFTLAGFTLGVVMMALGLSRYQLFNLDRWWYQYWTWFFAGIAVLVLDIALIGLLHVNQGLALGLSVAAVGWLYVPVRQLFWQWLRPSAESSLQEQLPDMIRQMFGAGDAAQMHDAWRVILQRAFAPLLIEEMPAAGPVRIVDNGQRLQVPSVAGMPGWLLAYAGQGGRLFSRRDEELATMMLSLVEKAWQAIQARNEGMLAERDRIRRDLHDDLGARLLGVMHSAELAQSQQQARQAMADLRSILNALEQTPCELAEALQLWQAETRERLLAAGLELDWQQQLDGSVMLNARARHNLGRVLRELVSNVLRHSGGDQLQVRVMLDGRMLQLLLEDNGKGLVAGQSSAGQGRRIVETRLAELGGTVQWQDTGNGCQVRVLLGL